MNADRRSRVRMAGPQGSSRREEDQADSIGKTHYRPHHE